MAVSLAGRHHVRYSAACHPARRLDQHLQVIAIGKLPLHLANQIAG